LNQALKKLLKDYFEAVEKAAIVGKNNLESWHKPANDLQETIKRFEKKVVALAETGKYGELHNDGVRVKFMYKGDSA